MDIKAKVAAAIATLKPVCGEAAINAIMASGFEDLLATNGLDVGIHAPGGLYINAMRTGFYAGNPAELVVTDREVAVLAILTVQGADANLALHIFIALVSGISVQHVLNVILLAGMYSGANLLSHAMKVTTKTFAAIIKAAGTCPKGPGDVFTKIMDEFPDAPFDAAKMLAKHP